jgi:hypothetical protein
LEAMKLGRPRKYLVPELGIGIGQGIISSSGAARNQRYRAEKEALGLCIYGACPNPRRPHAKSCQEHADYYKANYEARKANGLCATCGKVAPAQDKKNCDPCIERHYWYSVGRFYNLTKAQVEEMLESQGHKCALCKRDLAEAQASRRRKRGAIDHSVRTDKVRGILCNDCNTMIGYTDEIPDIFELGIAYVRGWEEQHAAEGDRSPEWYPNMPLALRQRMIEAQDNKCALCKRDFSETQARRRKPRAPSLDHSHTTHKVRGMLCDGCNPMTGYAHEKPGVLEQAAAYIRYWDEKHAAEGDASRRSNNPYWSRMPGERRVALSRRGGDGATTRTKAPQDPTRRRPRQRFLAIGGTDSSPGTPSPP